MNTLFDGHDPPIVNGITSVDARHLGASLSFAKYSNEVHTGIPLFKILDLPLLTVFNLWRNLILAWERG